MVILYLTAILMIFAMSSGVLGWMTTVWFETELPYISTHRIHDERMDWPYQQINQFAAGCCGCCGCCGDPQRISPTDIPPLPTAHSQHPSTHSQHHRTLVKYRFTVMLWAIFEYSMWSAFNLETILLLAKLGNNNIGKSSDMHKTREFFGAKSMSFVHSWSWADGVEEWDEGARDKNEASMNNLEKLLVVPGWACVARLGVSVGKVVDVG